MKQGWNEKTLNEVTSCINGLWTGKKPPFIKVGVIRNTNFRKDFILDFSDIAELEVENRQYLSRKLLPGDIVLEKSGGGPKQPVGRTVLFTEPDGEYSFSNFTSVLRINNPNEVDCRYLHKFLSYCYITGVTEKMQSHSTGIRNLKLDEFRGISIPLPRLEEQQRIVAILDQAFAAIETAKANTEKNLQNVRELFEVYLQDISAEKVSLRDLVTIKTGKLDANAAKSDGQYPFFTCAREVYSIDKYAFDCEAILLAGNNAVGDFNVKHYKGKFNAYQRTYVITVNQDNKVLYRYLYFQLLDKLKEFKVQAVGAGTKFLKLGMIQNMEIPLPSLDDQVNIVAKLDILDSETKQLGDIYRKKLFGLEDLKKSIFQKAFNGEL